MRMKLYATDTICPCRHPLNKDDAHPNCEYCKGTGVLRSVNDCTDCDGSGRATYREIGTADHGAEMDCEACKGSGVRS